MDADSHSARRRRRRRLLGPRLRDADRGDHRGHVRPRARAVHVARRSAGRAQGRREGCGQPRAKAAQRRSSSPRSRSRSCCCPARGCSFAASTNCSTSTPVSIRRRRSRSTCSFPTPPIASGSASISSTRRSRNRCAPIRRSSASARRTFCRSSRDGASAIRSRTHRSPPDQAPQAQYHIADEGYFSTLRVPLVAGRVFTAQDNAQSVAGRRHQRNDGASRCGRAESRSASASRATITGIGPLSRRLVTGRRVRGHRRRARTSRTVRCARPPSRRSISPSSSSRPEDAPRSCAVAAIRRDSRRSFARKCSASIPRSRWATSSRWIACSPSRSIRRAS